jgi:CHAD domain-containing protein
VDDAPREREWQFDALDLRPVAAWVARAELVAVAGVAAVPAGETDQQDTYYDTEDWRLHRAGLSVRVRHKASGDEATLKSHATGEGMRDRLEISQAVRRRNGALPTSGPVGDYVKLLCGRHPLRELVETRTHRTKFDLTVDGTRAGELALDDTRIPVDGGEPARILRVEVEVTGTSPERLEPFVERLRAAGNLLPSPGTKLEAGLFVRGLEPPAPVDAGSTTVDPAGTIGEFAFAVLRRHYTAMLDHEPGTRLGADPEELHDMRVSIRRLRANLKLFSDALPARGERLRGELGWIAAELGTVRDLDVQLERETEWAKLLGPPDDAGLEPLAAMLRGRRDVARRHLVRALDSRRYERLVASFADFLRRGPNRTQPGAARSAREALPDLVTTRHKRVRRCADRITKSSPAVDYHELRILVKRYRYALEAVGPVYAGAGPVVKRLVALQDLLGAHQDADIGVITLRELASEGRLPPATLFAMGRLAERLDVEAADLRRRFPKVMGKAEGAEWKKLRGELR